MRWGQLFVPSPAGSEFASVGAIALTLQPQSRGRARAFPCGCPRGQRRVSDSPWEALGWGGRMVLGAAAYGGESREEAGQAIALLHLTPPPSRSCTSLGAGHHDTKGFIFTSQSPENCSFCYIDAAGYQFGPAPSQCSWVKCASVSPLEPALPNPPPFPTSPAPAWVEIGATHGEAAFAPRALPQPRGASWLPASAEPSPPSSPKAASATPITRLVLPPGTGG